MTPEEAWAIIGDQPKATIKNMVMALSLHSHLNTAEDARRLIAARICLDPVPRRRLRADDGECGTCDRARDNEDNFLPPHDASPRCESGHRVHCSCDVCF